MIDKQKIAYKKWYNKNKEKESARKKKYYLENTTLIKENIKLYKKQNPDIVKETTRKYRENNAQKIVQQRQRYYYSNKEKLIASSKEWHNNNQDRTKENRRLWNEENKENIAKYNKFYQKYRREIDPVFRTAGNLRSRTSIAFKRMGYKKGGTTENLLGVDYQSFIQYITGLLKEGMSLDNYGEWEIDHHIPLCSAKTEDELRKLCHYSNLKPLWKSENRAKSHKQISI